MRVRLHAGSHSESLELRRLLSGPNLVNGNDLDTTFGTAGTSAFDFGGTSETVGDVILAGGGGTFVLEHHLSPSEQIPQGTASKLLRVNADGIADSTFGTSGFVDLPPNTAFNVNQSMLATPDGHLVTAGSTRIGSVSAFEGVDDFAIQQFNADGSPDTSFGTGGRTVTDIAAREDLAVKVLRQADGKLIVVGYEQHTFLSRVFQRPHTAIVRYNADGSVDTTFGTGGKVITEMPGFEANRAASAVLQPDGKIVVVGNANRREGDGSIVQGDQPQVLVMRYDVNGRLDPSFSGDGIVVTRTNGAANDVQIDTNGAIVVAGRREDRKLQNSFAVFRFNADGTTDRRFGRGGVAIASAKDLGTAASDLNAATALAVQPDRKVVAVGQAGNARMALVRFDSRGKLDADFGDPVLTDAAMSDNSGVLLQDDGKIVTWTGGGNDVTLARYNGVTVKPFATVSRRTLRITGTDAADDIHVAVAEAPVFRMLSVRMNGFEQLVTESDVDRISIDAGDGDDKVEIDAGLLIPSRIDGGNGFDTISGGGDADQITGGIGRDTITGNGGRDRLVGGFDDDVFFARDGEIDTIDGGPGNDLSQLDAGLDRGRSVEHDVPE
jgi:uncharacterized delta-60 repeat protein